MDMKELRTSMDTIRKTAGSFIDSMTEVIQRLMREQPELSLSGHEAGRNTDRQGRTGTDTFSRRREKSAGQLCI